MKRKYLSELRISPEFIDLSSLTSIPCEKTATGQKTNRNIISDLFKGYFVSALTSISIKINIFMTD
jgi:hypothetical protein